MIASAESPARCVEIKRWREREATRYEARIPPTDSDAKWFQRNRRSRNGWPRRYRVRPAVKSDHWRFEFGYDSPASFLTIVCNYQFWRAIVAVDEATFGPMVDCDEYAQLRINRLEANGGRFDTPGVAA